MFDSLSGTITAVKEKSITLVVGGIGFKVFVPKAQEILLQSSMQLFTYFHWNTDHGPSLYGFITELDRTVFLLIIDCHKIGPTIALNILSQISAAEFLEIVTAGNQAALSNVNGIGSKKAEQIIVELKHKVQKLISSGELKIEQQQSFAQWQQLSEVLSTLNYTKPEIGKATQFVAEKYAGQNYPLDVLIRTALAYLSQKQA